MAAPVYPLESLYGPKHQFSWISLHDTYMKWLDGYGPSILHVHGITSVSDASEYIFQCLNAYKAAKPDNKILVYFTFKEHDDRCNSVVAMLNTLLAQIFNHNPELYNTVKLQYKQISHHCSWTQAELFLLFQMTLADLHHGGILCVINSLDKCNDSREAFLKDLCRFFSLTERRCQIVITSTANSALHATLAEWPTINLDDRIEDSDIVTTTLASDVNLEVLELMQDCPVFCGFEKKITEDFLKYGQDKHRRHLVLHQLRLSKGQSTKAAAHQELDLLLSTTLKDMYARILARVPSERQIWACRALSWILYAFHPLRIWELTVALALEVNAPSDETTNLAEMVHPFVIADLENVFGGMVIVKHTEVHFSHPNVRDFLLAADCEQEYVWYDVKRTAHQEITDSCHLYLSLQQVQESIAISQLDPPTGPLESPTLTHQYSLHFYATKYWPKHYRLIREPDRPTKCALEFVQNERAMRCWAESYWWFSNPINRRDRAFKSMLLILASLGLQDLVIRWLDLDAETPEANQDRALALAEAARSAYVETVRRLLLYGGYSEASLEAALVAAASSCDEVVLDELITYAVENFEDFKWPQIILCRAAQFGLKKVVEKLLTSGASLERAVTFLDKTPLHLAAQGGHAEVVKVLLELKASLTTLDKYDRAPLYTASAYGHAPIVKLLIDAGAEVNAVDADTTNAMEFPCWFGYYKAVDVLTEAGCGMSTDKQGDWSPLTIVSVNGYVKSAQFLLKKKANTEIEGPGRGTPLRYAARKGHVELCRLLLEHGADANALGGEAPILSESASNGNLEVVKLLIENGAAVDAVGSKGWTALQKASVSGHVSVVTYLLDNGAYINHTNEYEETPILLAAKSNFAELVQLLISRGADLHCATTDGWTPIHLSYDDVETTRVLMENGADANRVANYFTPLYLAALNNYLEVIKVLVSFKPNLEIQNANKDSYHTGFTALSIATNYGYTDAVRLLLDAGANVNHQCERNNFPVQYAVTFNREDLLRALMEYRPNLDLVDNDGDTALNYASSASLSVVKLLVNGGSDLNTRNNMGQTPLCGAVMSENLRVVEYLIAKKAELNIIGGMFGGPLHVACRWSKLNLVKVLLAAGADVNLVDSSVGTPLQSACSWCNSRKQVEIGESIIRYLINDAKADVKTIGGVEGCALNAACKWSTPEMVKLILEKGAKIDIKDGMGRVAIHFAAAQSLEHLQLILEAGADVEVMDKMGRTAMHWAATSGKIDVVERVLFLSRGLVDQADIDGWTPLLWVARGCGTPFKSATSKAQEEIIKLLLVRGADPCVRGKGLDREWSPVKVARYHGVDDAVVQLLIVKAKEKLAADGVEDTWDETFHTSRKALKQEKYCDSCFLVSTICTLILLMPAVPRSPPTLSSITISHQLLCIFADTLMKDLVRYCLQVRDLLEFRPVLQMLPLWPKES